MSDISIQETTIDEAAKVHAKIKEFNQSDLKPEYWLKCQGKTTLIIIATNNRQPAGYLIGYDRDSDGSFYCWMTAVDHKHRQQGILTAMMDYQAKWARQHSYDKIKIKTRNNRREMIAYLIKYGFYFTGFEPRERIEDHRIMLEKCLAAKAQSDQSVIFKEFKAKDLAAIVRANSNIFDDVYDVEPYTLKDYKNRLSRVEPYILVAYDGQKIAGDSIAFAEEHAWNIWVLGVDPTYRRRGIATRLFQMNEEYARENGYKTITTKVYQASDNMLKLVKKLGYSVIKFKNGQISKDQFYYKIRKQL